MIPIEGEVDDEISTVKFFGIVVRKKLSMIYRLANENISHGICPRCEIRLEAPCGSFKIFLKRIRSKNRTRMTCVKIYAV